MKQKTNPSKTKRLFGIGLTSFILILSAFLFSDCDSKATTAYQSIDLVTGTSVTIDYTKYTPPQDVPSKSEDASVTELAEFAWQEFIALNWPAKSSSRGLPDTSKANGFITASQVGGATYTPVWQTYWHRNELFPATGKTPVQPSTSDSSLPNYQYAKTYPFGGTGTGNYTLWNNLDEVNELGEDVVFAHSTTSTINSQYQVLYEAKMNYDGASYIYTNNLNDPTTRSTKKTNTMNSLAAKGVCDADTTKYICLPCGDITSKTEGNIEIKAAWRQLDSTKDTLANFYTQEVIYYENDESGGVITSSYKNVTMGLVGLHIIHKTETFPDYVFATWEQKDNISSDLVYTEIETTAFGDQAKTNNVISRTHPIPSSITAVNNVVSKYLKTNTSVWQHYKLINVQAKPNDVSALTGSGTDADNSYFYLSNSVIESNIELQTFTGSLTDPNVNNLVYKNNMINMGGCMGCHGNAQLAGSDLNFLIPGAPFSVPEFTGVVDPGCPEGGAAFAINNWQDVKKFFNLCVVETTIGRSPHGKFWEKYGANADMKNYKLFTTGDVPGVPGTKICTPGDSLTSNIILRLKGMGVTQMPGGGPFYTEKQVSELAKWIQAGCQF